jgi:hypothetical protein
MCVFWFSLQLLCETFLILRRIHQDTIINKNRSSCKVPSFLPNFNDTWIFSTYFRKKKNLKCEILWKSVQWEPSGSMRTDRQTNMTKWIVAFRNFSNAPTNCSSVLHNGSGKYGRRLWIVALWLCSVYDAHRSVGTRVSVTQMTDCGVSWTI